jgi:ComF family protein
VAASFASGLNGVASALFTTLFPSDCRLCGTPLNNLSCLPVCKECLLQMHPIAGGICSICGEKLVSQYAFSPEDAEPRCGLCHRFEPPFVKAAAYGSYEGGLRELIHLLKYDSVRPAAKVLGRMLAEAISHLESAMGPSPFLIVPVPLHPRKLRQRGFNQSELIAQAAWKLVSFPDRVQLASAALERRRETQSQIGLSRRQRRENMRGAFAVKHAEEIKSKSILLVDDVFTTGTTVSECTRVLRRAGASKVYVATVARTLKIELQGAALEEPEIESEAAMAAHAS